MDFEPASSFDSPNPCTVQTEWAEATYSMCPTVASVSIDWRAPEFRATTEFGVGIAIESLKDAEVEHLQGVFDEIGTLLEEKLSDVGRQVVFPGQGLPNGRLRRMGDVVDQKVIIKGATYRLQLNGEYQSHWSDACVATQMLRSIQNDYRDSLIQLYDGNLSKSILADWNEKNPSRK